MDRTVMYKLKCESQDAFIKIKAECKKQKYVGVSHDMLFADTKREHQQQRSQQHYILVCNCYTSHNFIL